MGWYISQYIIQIKKNKEQENKNTEEGIQKFKMLNN